MRRLLTLTLLLAATQAFAGGFSLIGTSTGFTSASGGGTANVELRCAELSTSCLMSEPLNTNGYVWTQPGQIVDPRGTSSTCVSTGGGNYSADVDFADSEGAGYKEATEVRWGACAYTSPLAVTDPSVGLPGTASGINYVMKADVGSAIMDSNNFPSGNKRLCMRHYKKFSPNFAGFQVCGADKLMEVWAGQTSIQLSEHGDIMRFEMSAFSNWSAWDGATFENKSTLPSAMYVTDCQSNWCRFEMCIETTDADIKTLTNVTLDWSITQVGIGSPKTGGRTLFLGSEITGGLSSFQPWLNYRDNFGVDPRNCQDLDPSSWGYTLISHIAKAGWTTASGQTIGPAYEIEGGP